MMEEGLINCMLACQCPRKEVALGILQKMEGWALLKKIVDDQGTSYMRAAEGIKQTPAAPPGATPGTRENN